MYSPTVEARFWRIPGAAFVRAFFPISHRPLIALDARLPRLLNQLPPCGLCRAVNGTLLLGFDPGYFSRDTATIPATICGAGYFAGFAPRWRASCRRLLLPG